MAVIVSLPPAFSACGLYCLRRASSAVMSALSCCVTCGMAFQACVRCSAVLRRMLLIGLRSTSPHLVKSGSAEGALAGTPPPANALRTNACTSSTLMRPAGPLPATPRMSTPSSRARRRTDGAAGAAGPGDSASTCGCGAGMLRAAPLMSTTSPRLGLDSGAGVSAAPPASPGSAHPLRVRPPAAPSACRQHGLGGTFSACAGRLSLRSAFAGAAPLSSVSTTCPTFTFSPCLILTSVTVPLTVDGTSIVALSVSSSRTG